MDEKVRSYLERAGLTVSKDFSVETFLKKASDVLNEKKEEDPKLLSYVVPKMTPDGTCSLPDDLDPNPYNLGKTLLKNDFAETETLDFVSRVDALVMYLHTAVGSDWTGVYKRLMTPEGATLVKIAYRGRPSRAEFPWTDSFASHSNNSTVALSGKAVVVSSVKKHQEAGNPYYECDADVQSELCVPLFSDDGEISGIIDLESFKENHFNDERILMIAAACVVLGPFLTRHTPSYGGQ